MDDWSELYISIHSCLFRQITSLNLSASICSICLHSCRIATGSTLTLQDSSERSSWTQHSSRYATSSATGGMNSSQGQNWYGELIKWIRFSELLLGVNFESKFKCSISPFIFRMPRSFPSYSCLFWKTPCPSRRTAACVMLSSGSSVDSSPMLLCRYLLCAYTCGLN